ncbi:lipoate--protein ligase family protein [Sporomusa acidovorans]|uniref:Octanoyltransferase LipM n=1 Tax=Sporomusa acidovorans (strain ATCC 49682 / DSM 3132 / Mol) TaxID=1123286 RepID=A0ABZ3J6G4_SPOA4|nr:biotin/lipoate A/B protein ligase family protein [Sporomusa acidovorans]OZC15646.1 lipoate-protein ligase LplJ [Sporomusa acidovorans DSM 3132]SDE88121.1 lipoate-protein ligase A [Sporomusa acidovorans]
MKLYRLGAIPWDETQAVYHALAQMRQEGLVLCRPLSRCVCLGLHDDLQQELDQRYCQENNIPLIRRDIGGGTVLLAEGQLFFQLVLRATNPLLTGKREQFFHRFLQPAIKTLADFGINAAVKLPADIVVNGKKISGNGAGDINGFAVYTGNILLAFDRTVMANVLHAASCRYREWIKLSLEKYLTTMGEELGYMPAIEAVEKKLADHFAAWLELEPGVYSEDMKEATASIAGYLTSQEFLHLPGKRSKIRQIKINEGTYVRLHPFPQCIRSSLDGQSRCPGRFGRPCSGYGIMVVQNNRIIEFESQGLSCLENVNLQSLPQFLNGCYLQELAVAQALKKWTQNQEDGEATLFLDIFSDWILAR